MSIPSPTVRHAAATAAGINAQYLYQCLTRRRDMDARLAVRLESTSGGAIRRWHVRRDWPEVWPELVGADGAPAVQAAEAGHAG